MSETDSFINEVSDEVRRDQLFTYIRRYGWIAVLAILLLVGGAAYNEISKARTSAAAEAVGDTLMAAMSMDAPEDRIAALQAEGLEGAPAVIAGFLLASEQETAGNAADAVATLDAISNDATVDQPYRELALFKAAMLRTDPAERRAAFDSLAQPGATYALLAQEQIALLQVSEGDSDAAVATLRAIIEDAGVSRGLRERAQTLMVALGAPLDAAASQ